MPEMPNIRNLTATKMISLTKPLAWSWRCADGRDYRVNLAFDNVLRWYDLLGRKDLTDADKGVIGWRMFVNADSVGPMDRIRALKWIGDYLAEEPYHDPDDDSVSDDASGDPDKYFSYTQDAPAIWSSIRAYYGIDLEEELGKLHWHKFRALLDGLPSSSYFMRIIDIRRRPRTGLEGEELTSLVEAQERYMLDEYRNADHQSEALDFFTAWAAQATKTN